VSIAADGTGAASGSTPTSSSAALRKREGIVRVRGLGFEEGALTWGIPFSGGVEAALSKLAGGGAELGAISLLGGSHCSGRGLLGADRYSESAKFV